MFRYRCPQCSVVLQALEIRAGKTTVCSKCSQPVTIPADRRHWLNENGEPLIAAPTMVIPSSGSGLTPAPTPRPQPQPDADNDVLGAIAHGDIAPPSQDMSEVETPPPSEPESAPPSPAFSRSLPGPDADDGRVELYPPAAAAQAPPPAKAAPKPFPVPRRPEPTPPPKKPFPTPPPAWATASKQGSSRTRRPAPEAALVTAPAPEPLKLRTSADIAVELTSTLASRMKPPPKPPRDLNPSTAVWILTTGIAITLIAATLFSANTFTPLIVAIGIAQALAGYAWVTSLAFKREVRRGVACAVPPLTFMYLTNKKYGRYRPLRFVVSGLAILGIGLLLPRMQGQTRAWANVGSGQQPIEAQVPITNQPKVIQLKHYRDQRQYDALISLLRSLARTDSTYSEDSKNRVELSAALKELCSHSDDSVRAEALAAYTTWGGPDARELALNASRSKNPDEREMALKVLPRWKDEDVARRMAEMIGRPGKETSLATDALITLGGPVAERAAISLLRRDDQNVRLAAIEILGNEKVGGRDAVAALREMARVSADPGTRQPAEVKANQIEARLNK
jgi:hypothetical protein